MPEIPMWFIVFWLAWAALFLGYPIVEIIRLKRRIAKRAERANLR